MHLKAQAGVRMVSMLGFRSGNDYTAHHHLEFYNGQLPNKLLVKLHLQVSSSVSHLCFFLLVVRLRCPST
jgi:hypothetical protein